MTNQIGTVIWFTGLSGSGKSTIAAGLKEKLEARGKRVAVLDGDDVRGRLHKHLGFSRKDIRENNRLIAELAREEAAINDFVLVPIISPYREDRAIARSIVGSGFLELFVNAPLDVCIARDAKGLYQKALAGEIDNFIGVSPQSPYEAPEHPDIEVHSDGEEPEKCVENIVRYFHDKKVL